MPDPADVARLFLVTPANIDREGFAARLREALAAGDVAAVLIAASPATDAAAREIVAIVQSAGAAALIPDDTRLADRLNADGVHVSGGIDALRAAVDSLRPRRIVGAGNLSARHAAMQAGEVEPDYVFFGRPHGDTHDMPHPKALELAEWWSDLLELPAVIMAGCSIDSVTTAAATGADFVALHDAVWSHPEGAGAAVRQAMMALERNGRRAA